MGELHKTCQVCGGTGRIILPVGDRVKDVRSRHSLTQEEFARSLGISRPALANIEAGRQDLTNRDIVSIARLYAVSADWLLGLEPSP